MYQQLKQVVEQMTSAGQMFEVRESEVAGITLKTWAMAPPSLRDVWLSTAGHGDKDYLVYQQERWTYAQAHKDVASIASWLSANGIKQHDRVAIAMRNYPEFMLTYWALSCIGAVTVGINAWWVPEELEYGLQDSETKMLICDSERLERFSEIRKSFPDMPVVAVRVDNHPEWTTPFSEVLESPASLP
jgi:acyl-CoA synthetase (AMP-forming)/AMP-acid ligase II